MKSALARIAAVAALPCALWANRLDSPIAYAAGVNTRGVLIADLNGDGVNEVVAANFGSGSAIGQASQTDGSVMVYAQAGGALVLKQTLLPGKAPREVAAMDVNADGRLDLLVTLYGEDALAVFLQQADGRFTLAGKVATPGQPVGLAVKPDGRPVVAVAGYASSTVQMYTGNGAGMLAPMGDPIQLASSGQAASPTAVAFINLNGVPCLVTANYGANTLSLIVEATGQTKTIALPAGSLPCKLAVGDFNQDGAQDLAVALFGEDAQGKSSVAVLTQNGAGLSDPVVLAINGKHPNGIACGNVTGSGAPALVLAGRDNDTLDVAALDAAGKWSVIASFSVAEAGQSAREAFQGPVGVAVGDVTGDGRADIVIGYNQGAGKVKVLAQRIPMAPKMAGGSHPDPTKWYPNPNVTLGWEAVADLAGIKGYRVLLDEAPASVPGQDGGRFTEGTTLQTDGVASGEHWAHVQAVDRNGNLGETTHTAIRIAADLSQETVYNYPNPARSGSTTIRFMLPQPQAVSLRLYDGFGGLVWSKDLGESETQAGLNQVLWNCVNDRGASVGNGGYILKVSSGNREVVKKVAVLR